MSTITILEVAVPETSASTYPVYIERDSLRLLGERLRHHFEPDTRVLLISDETVHGLYGQTAEDALNDASFVVTSHHIPDGETSKTLAQAESIYQHALLAGLSRNDVMVALGGGVVGDLAGFCASTYFRGIDYIHVPTTLLAQVDSAIGGKVAVNIPGAKNAVGAFYPPRMVLMDPELLLSLNAREFRAGLAEVVKYSLIEESCAGKTGFFNFLATHGEHIADLYRALPQIIERCCRIKADVVNRDEKDKSGLRALLNMGHTFAHAIEEATEYEVYLHGEAVGIGMGMACRLSQHLGMLSESDVNDYFELTSWLGVVSQLQQPLSPEMLLSLMRQDKKAVHGKINLVLPTEHFGKAVLRDDVSESDILQVLKS